jgi:hypothetical protein
MRYHDRLSLLTWDPTRAAEAAVTSILFHRDHALAEAAALSGDPSASVPPSSPAPP